MTTTFNTLVHYFHDNKDNAERCCGAFVALEVLKMNEMCSFLKNVHYQGVT